MKIKYYNDNNSYVINDYKIVNSERILITGNNIPQNTSGFYIYDDNDVMLCDCSQYVVVYNSGDGFIEYTNDTAIYYVFYTYNEDGYVTDILITTLSVVENGILIDSGQGKEYTEAVIDIAFKDDYGLYNYKVVDGALFEVTDEEKALKRNEKIKAELTNNKQLKINESKSLLETYLANHPLISDCHNGIDAIYSVTLEKQNLMTSHYATYTIEKNLGLNPVLKWNATGAEREEWTEEEFIQLILEIKVYVEPLVSLQQSYEVQIRNCTTQEELDAIEITYDVYGIAEE